MNKYPSKKELRKSSFIFSIISLLIFVLLPYTFSGNLNYLNKAIIFLSSTILLLGFISPFSLRRINNLWINLGIKLGKINSNLILIFFFYIIITPASFLRRIIKKFLFKKKNIKSNYITVDLGHEINFKDQY